MLLQKIVFSFMFLALALAIAAGKVVVGEVKGELVAAVQVADR